MFNRCSFKAVILNSISILLFAFSALIAVPIADKSSKFLGNITSGTPSSNFGDYWNQITLENGGKWGSVQPSNQNSFNWSQTDNVIKYVKVRVGHLNTTVSYGDSSNRAGLMMVMHELLLKIT